MEENLESGVEGLPDRPPVFSALYLALFSRTASANHRYVSLRHPNFAKSADKETLKGLRIVDYMIDSKPQAVRELKEISAVAICPRLPVVAVGEGTDLLFLSIKSMACITRCALPSTKAVTQVVFDDLTFKFFAVDAQNTAFLYRFSLEFEQIELIKALNGHRVAHGAFVRNSTAVLFTTKGNYCLSLDLMTLKETKIELFDSALIKNRLSYVRKTDRVLLLNRKRGLFTLADSQELSNKQNLSLPAEEVSCFVVSGGLLLVGYVTGLLRVVGLQSGEALFEQTFEDAEGKKVAVEELAVLKGFVIVGLANGIVAIVNKI